MYIWESEREREENLLGASAKKENMTLSFKKSKAGIVSDGIVNPASLMPDFLEIQKATLQLRILE